MGSWMVADSLYEAGAPEFFHLRSQQSYEGWQTLASNFKQAPLRTTGHIFAPGLTEALTHPHNPEAWGRATFDTALLALPSTRLIGRRKPYRLNLPQMPAREISKIAPTVSTGKHLRGITKTGRRNRLHYDPTATGAHSVIRRNSAGRVTNYETFRRQTNPYDPKPWESLKRFDRYGDSHFNKVLDTWIDTPHVHDPLHPGGIRPAQFWEKPR